MPDTTAREAQAIFADKGTTLRGKVARAQLEKRVDRWPPFETTVARSVITSFAAV